MPTYTFKPPTARQGAIGKGRLFSFYSLDVGISVYNDGSGNYSETQFPIDETIKGYSEFYRGGYNHVVDQTTANRLIAAGYKVVVS